MTIAPALADAVLTELEQALGSEHVHTSKTARFSRARVPAPFPVHRWAEHVPDVVVMPGTTEEVAEVVRIANRHRIPIVPRDGGTGLTDGARPERRGPNWSSAMAVALMVVLVFGVAQVFFVG